MRAQDVVVLLLSRGLREDMASFKETIKETLKETLREELSRAFGVENKNSNGGETSTQNTLTFEEFYAKREAERQKGFKPAKKKKKQSSAASSTSTTSTSKKVVDVEIKVGIACWSDGVFKSRRGKTHIVKVKSNAARDDIIMEAVNKHASFDQNFDEMPAYVLLYPDFREIFFIPGTANVFTLSAYKEALGREYKRLTFYLMKRDEFENTETCNNSSGEETDSGLKVQTSLDDYMKESWESLIDCAGNIKREGIYMYVFSPCFDIKLITSVRQAL